MFLILDTSTRRLLAAAVHEDGRVEIRHGEKDLDHSITLIAALRSLIETTPVAGNGKIDPAPSRKSPEGIGVCLGPGSFTGTRIGLATVRAMVQFGGMPAWGFTLFHAMALHAFLHHDAGVFSGPGGVMAAIHARADQYYQARLEMLDGVPRLLEQPFVGILESRPAIASWDREPGAVEGIPRYQPENLPVAALAALFRKMGRDMSPAGDGLKPSPPGWQGRLLPLYLQEPFAKVKSWNQ